ncbi:MAG: tetratricopeptide repeat protein [Candidatus Omnitrophica bacterium]|nr:tetratricopeptide repeat protein [Candidatus Omnitrophota bacterium]
MKTIRVVLTILMGGLLLAGCGMDQYAIERRHWHMMRQAEKVFRNPHASPPQELSRVVGLLKDFAGDFPNNALSVEAEFTIAKLYLVKKEYTHAREYLKELLGKYAKVDPVASEIHFLMGNSFELEGDWDQALQQYKTIIERYPLTMRGLSAPIYISQYYKVKYQPDRMVAALQEAITHYKALSLRYPNSPLSYRTDILVAECLIALKDWKGAVAHLDSVLTKYKGKVPLDSVMINMILMYKDELKDIAKAKALCERLIQEYPKSKAVPLAQGILKGTE